ncbi:MAG: glycerophosphodiester phosphodiesterase family protein [Pyrinomonadaceae bacterium]
MSTHPLIIGHRGACAVAPENTLLSFARAFDDGADGIEFDVRLASDHVPICIHDATLERTALKPGSVGSLTSKQLASVDVGSWFNRRFPAKADAAFSAAKIPTLDETLTLAYARQAKAVYVELKCSSADEAEGLARATAAVIRHHRAANVVIVESFTLEAISAVKRYAPELRTAALFERTATRPFIRSANIIALALQHNADELALQRTLIHRSVLKAASEVNLLVVVWTVDDPRWLNRAQDLGLKAIITNDPRAMRERNSAA